MIRARPPTQLSSINDTLEATGALPHDMWNEWLWKTDPEEPFSQGILMNRCHLVGLLVCRHQADDALDAEECCDERMTLMAKRPSTMTLRELKDTVDNVLIEWPRFLSRLGENPKGDENLQAVVGLIDACMTRFGQLASNPGTPEVFDDAGSTEPHASQTSDGSGLVRLTRPAIRRMLGGFLVLYRHVHLLARAEPVEPIPHDCGIRRHHVEASTDDFNMLCMSMRLPVAARLNYKQDFPGMYNHVSQVVYFHDPQYERMPRVGMDKMFQGDPMQVLPALCQLHPEIGMAYEEDCINLSEPTGKWHWMVVPGRVYLVDPDSRVYHSENVTSLMRLYLEAVEATPSKKN